MAQEKLKTQEIAQIYHTIITLKITTTIVGVRLNCCCLAQGGTLLASQVIGAMGKSKWTEVEK